MRGEGFRVGGPCEFVCVFVTYSQHDVLLTVCVRKAVRERRRYLTCLLYEKGKKIKNQSGIIKIIIL